jgi:Ser/Thr protein kinase RdoA (MazF antagonist)
MSVQAQAFQFQTDARPVFSMPFGNGHINKTYLVVDSLAQQYILQAINKNVFKNPEAVMDNIIKVTGHLRKTVRNSRQVMLLVPAVGGGYRIIDRDGEYWRMYRFIGDSVSLDRGTPEEFRQNGIAFGRFQRQMADFPADSLAETIPHFHDTPLRYEALQEAVKADCLKRAAHAEGEIEFACRRKGFTRVLRDLQDAGEIPLRTTHNDTKLSNVLLDRQTRKALCVVDLDTVMPGLAVTDFGDAIRYGASGAAEDEPDLAKVNFSLPLYKAFSRGFLSACGESLTPCELSHLPTGAKMMALEQGIRFLTDYLQGDTYYKTTRKNQNLERCRTQFKLVADMEQAWEQMHGVINKLTRKF